MAVSKISGRFCAADADTTVASSDGVLLKVHRKNLAVHSHVFAHAEDTTRTENGDEIVHLTESSTVLDLLFQFMYRQPQPDLDTLEFKTFASLAEAAEKYVVYSALGLTLCRMKMNDSISTHPFEVLRYAARHDHVHLANEAAQRSMGRGVAEALEVLPYDIFATWILFRERWHQEIFRGLTDMMYYDSHIPLVRRCIADPNPVSAFRQELDDAGLWGRKLLKRMAELKFMIGPTDAKHIQNIDQLFK